MDFLIQWLSCVAAFVAGSAAAWVIVGRVIKPSKPVKRTAKVSRDASV